MVWLPGGEKALMILAISTEYRHVTDRRTDILGGIVRAMHTRRAVMSDEFKTLTKRFEIYDDMV